MVKPKGLSSSHKETDQISGKDQLSKLPQHIRHHILSKLPSEDAMRTMVLSKAWRNEWLTSPYLDLAKEMWDRFPNDTELKAKYLDFAFRTLTKRNDLNYLKIERLNLFLPGPSETRRAHNKKQADKLLRFAVTKYVIHELKLSSYSKDHYELSKDIIQHARYLTFLSLKCLIVDQKTIASVALNCPLLKSLKLKYCQIKDPKILISSFNNLVNLIVIATTTSSSDVMVEIIDAPALMKFRNFGICDNREKSQLFYVVSDSSCKGLKHMDLHGVWFDRNSLNRILSRLPNLDHLKLSCHLLCHHRLDICCPNLKYLELRLEDLLEELHIDAPNLKEFVYTFHAWDSHAMPVIFPSNGAGFNPKKVTINIDTSNKRLGSLLQDVQFNQFVKQLDGSPRHMMARMSINGQHILPGLKELNTCIYEFKHLVISYYDFDFKHDDFDFDHSLESDDDFEEEPLPEPATSQVLFKAIVDPVLCVFPNLQTCIILQRDSKWEPMELKLEFKYKGSEVHGCWQKRVQEVQVENIKGSKMYISPLAALFEEAIEAKKVVVQC